MEIEVGAILKGRVTGIAKFGAFVELKPGKSGLVYISEIANTFVKEVSDFLKVDQEVTVKVIGIDDNGRINLSIKQAAPQPAAPQAKRASAFEPSEEGVKREPREPRQFQTARESSDQVDMSFEDKLKRFMRDSDSKMSDIRHQADRRNSKRRR